jgi:hypothetical protein
MIFTCADPVEQSTVVGRPLILGTAENVQVTAPRTTAVKVSHPLVVTIEDRLGVNEVITGARDDAASAGMAVRATGA